MGFRKGNRVCATIDGETYHCTVKKGGKNIEAVVDGGTLVVKAHESKFKPSDEPMKTDEPSCMDKWSIKQYKDLTGHGDSESFSCKICLKNKPIALAYNSGHGGANEYSAMGRENQANLSQFLTDAEAWGKQFDSEFSFELDSLWIYWKQSMAPYNVTAREYLTR
jgi:hypothetical protein